MSADSDRQTDEQADQSQLQIGEPADQSQLQTVESADQSQFQLKRMINQNRKYVEPFNILHKYTVKVFKVRSPITV